MCRATPPLRRLCEGEGRGCVGGSGRSGLGCPGQSGSWYGHNHAPGALRDPHLSRRNGNRRGPPLPPWRPGFLGATFVCAGVAPGGGMPPMHTRRYPNLPGPIPWLAGWPPRCLRRKEQAQTTAGYHLHGSWCHWQTWSACPGSLSRASAQRRPKPGFDQCSETGVIKPWAKSSDNYLCRPHTDHWEGGPVYVRLVTRIPPGPGTLVPTGVKHAPTKHSS